MRTVLVMIGFVFASIHFAQAQHPIKKFLA
jgi:hypothetical protein